jgi:hypothetical protein
MSLACAVKLNGRPAHPAGEPGDGGHAVAEVAVQVRDVARARST